jgi:hypothetical protein
LKKNYDYVNYKLEEYISKYKENIELVADQHYMQKIKYLKGKRKELELLLEQLAEKEEENKDEIHKHYFKEIISDLQKKYYIEKVALNIENEENKIIETNQDKENDDKEKSQNQEDNLETNENNQDFSLNLVQLKSQSNNKDNNLVSNSKEKEINLEENSVEKENLDNKISFKETKKGSVNNSIKNNSVLTSSNHKLPSKNIDDLDESHDHTKSFTINNDSVIKQKYNINNNNEVDKNNSVYKNDESLVTNNKKLNYNYDASVDAIGSDDDFN